MVQINYLGSHPPSLYILGQQGGTKGFELNMKNERFRILPAANILMI